MEHTESRAGIGIQKPRDAPVLDGLWEYTGHGTSRPRNRTEKNQAAGIQAVRNGGVTESDYPLREIRESKGERLGTELLTGRGPGKAGPVHQLHIGTARLQHPVENVPQRHDRALRAVPEPFYLENESDTCLNAAL